MERLHRAGRMRRSAGVVAALMLASGPVLAPAADQWQISIGVRETGDTGAVGSSGSTSGGIEWVNLDGQAVNGDGAWHKYTWNFGSDPVTNFSGGNGVLSSANMRGVLEHIRIKNS